MPHRTPREICAGSLDKTVLLYVTQSMVASGAENPTHISGRMVVVYVRAAIAEIGFAYTTLAALLGQDLIVLLLRDAVTTEQMCFQPVGAPLSIA